LLKETTGVIDGLEPTADTLRVRRATHCVTHYDNWLHVYIAL